MHIDKQLNDYIANLLQTRIPANYYYHNYGHTLYVLEKVKEIGKQENCTARELELLAVAALWHDTGYIYTYAFGGQGRASSPANLGYASAASFIMNMLILAVTMIQLFVVNRTNRDRFTTERGT